MDYLEQFGRSSVSPRRRPGSLARSAALPEWPCAAVAPPRSRGSLCSGTGGLRTFAGCGAGVVTAARVSRGPLGAPSRAPVWT